jgi:hypothetical protein
MAGLVPAVALVSLVGVAAPTAHADAVDNNFLAAVKAKRINFASPQAAINVVNSMTPNLDCQGKTLETLGWLR